MNTKKYFSSIEMKLKEKQKLPNLEYLAYNYVKTKISHIIQRHLIRELSTRIVHMHLKKIPNKDRNMDILLRKSTIKRK